MPTPSVQLAHDALVAAMPPGARHSDCHLCGTGTDPTKVTTAKESIVPEERTYTEAEHFALMSDAVSRETAQVTEELASVTTERDELAARVDVLEAEKAAEVTAREAVQAEFDKYKDELEAAAEVEARKGARKAAIGEVAGKLPEDYFTDERVTRWAEMSDEQFENLLDDLVDSQIASLDPDTIAEFAELDGPAKRAKLSEVRAAQANAADAGMGAGVETAAFTGGQAPTKSGPTKLSQVLRAGGRPTPTAV